MVRTCGVTFLVVVTVHLCALRARLFGKPNGLKSFRPLVTITSGNSSSTCFSLEPPFVVRLPSIIVFEPRDVDHYHKERPHQGVGNLPLLGKYNERHGVEPDAVDCRMRLGGVLRHYQNRAA